MPDRPRGFRLACLGLLALGLAPAFGRETERIDVAGLNDPVEVLRDPWGVSHIYARNEHDLFFAQGFTAARDRLFQLEVWRRQATGTMAEIQGPAAVPRDIGARLLSYRGDLVRELRRYHPRGDSIVAAFVEGINAYIEQTEREPSLLPVEFQALGIRPGRWTREIVVSRHNGLTRNATQEVQLARLVHRVGSERARELQNLHPGRPQLEPDKAVDLGLIREAILGPYQASRSAVKFRPEDVGPSFRGRPAKKEPAAQPDAGDAAEAHGSNNWVVAGDRTFSRAAIMANDPHRNLHVPSLRYWIHLVAPGWNVIGAGEPALPGVSVGHNERGAWGFTIFPIDQEDLYVYETDPADANRYRHGEGWEPMRIERSTIAVKGQPAVEAELRFTRHGPVVYEDREHHCAYALRAAWLEEGTAPYLATLRLDQARNLTEFREACRHFRTPSENLVWADVDGHIAWQAVGLAPIRPDWNGLLPVPGDGRFEWKGFLPVLELPHETDPARGWIATANQDNLPADFPHAVGFQWTDPFRYARIVEVLGAERRFTLADMMTLQHDEMSLPARALVPLLRGLKPSAPEASQAAAALAEWDFVLSKGSVKAALYVAWEKALKREVAEVVVPREAREVMPAASLSTARLIDWLTAPDGRFGHDPIAGRDALLVRAFDSAFADLRKRLGPNPGNWTYGQPTLKHVRIRHPLDEAVNDALRDRLDPGPLPRGGYAHTVNSTSDQDNQATGATFRIIADTGDWDRSIGTNAPGQSGDPASPHYRDLFALWAEGRYFPVFFSRAKVEAVAELKTDLEAPREKP